jgi:hypothetical protein
VCASPSRQPALSDAEPCFDQLVRDPVDRARDAHTANAFSNKDGTRQFELGVNSPPSDSLTEAIFALASKAICGRK